MNFVVGVAHLRQSDLIKQGISSANALPSLIFRDCLGESRRVWHLRPQSCKQ